jgi:hypothetical protein
MVIDIAFAMVADMARLLRIEFLDALYHLTSHEVIGVDQSTEHAEDRMVFQSTLAEVIDD